MAKMSEKLMNKKKRINNRKSYAKEVLAPKMPLMPRILLHT
jgi:hypothetical protein